MTSGGLLDLDTSEVWHQVVVDYAREIEGPDWDDKIEHWPEIDNLGSHSAYQELREFIDTVSDERLAELLIVAVHGRRAFRHFKDVLGSHPEQLRAYLTSTQDRKIERAAAWLAEHGYVATGRSPERGRLER